MVAFLKLTAVFSLIVASIAVIVLSSISTQLSHISHRIDDTENELIRLEHTRSILEIKLQTQLDQSGPGTTEPEEKQTTHPNHPQFNPSLRHLDGGTEVFTGVLDAQDKQSRQNAFILEIGAGDGRQASEAAKAGYEVVSIEAFVNNIGAGKNRARGQGLLDKITFINSAVSNYDGTAVFVGISGMGRLMDNTTLDTDPSNDKAKWNKLPNGKKVQVNVRKVDHIWQQEIKRCPFVFKVDVEGSEVKAFEGAALFMKTCLPPILIIEFNPTMMQWSANSTGYDLLVQLDRLGYRLFDTKISEPRMKGFMSAWGTKPIPLDTHEYYRWLLTSRAKDTWGSWTDVIATLPHGTKWGMNKEFTWNGLEIKVLGRGAYKL